MKLQQITFSQAVHYHQTGEGGVRRSPMPMVRALEDRYGFVQIPRTMQEFDFNKGVTFLQGYFQGEVIDRFQMYERGLLCESKKSTSLCDLFLEEVFSWVPVKFDIPVKPTDVRSYASQVEVLTSIDIGEAFSKFVPIGKFIGEKLRSYGQAPDDFSISGLRMHYDIQGKPSPQAPEFAFERRATVPYTSNLFFSAAPLSTNDHLETLDVLEDLLVKFR